MNTFEKLEEVDYDLIKLGTIYNDFLNSQDILEMVQLPEELIKNYGERKIINEHTLSTMLREANQKNPETRMYTSILLTGIKFALNIYNKDEIEVSQQQLFVIRSIVKLIELYHENKVEIKKRFFYKRNNDIYVYDLFDEKVLSMTMRVSEFKDLINYIQKKYFKKSNIIKNSAELGKILVEKNKKAFKKYRIKYSKDRLSTGVFVTIEYLYKKGEWKNYENKSFWGINT